MLRDYNNANSGMEGCNVPYFEGSSWLFNNKLFNSKANISSLVSLFYKFFPNGMLKGLWLVDCVDDLKLNTILHNIKKEKIFPRSSYKTLFKLCSLKRNHDIWYVFLVLLIKESWMGYWIELVSNAKILHWKIVLTKKKIERFQLNIQRIESDNNARKQTRKQTL